MDLKKKKIIKYLVSLTEDRDFTMGLLQFCLTTRCQLNCSYCRMGKLPFQEMSLSTLKKGVDFLADSASDVITIQFFGGEPLLRWDLIKEGAEYFKKKTARLKKNKSISLATNGLLLNVEKTGFLKKIHKDFNVIFSFDGVLSQNLNRSPFKKKSADASFDSILKNLDNLIKAKLPFFVNMVVGPRNLDDVEKNIELLIAKGVTSIRLSYMMGVFWEKHMIKKFLDRVRKVYLNYKRQDLLVDIGHCHDEPVLISSGLTLMPDERLFVGTTYPLLNMFPHIKEFNCYGKLGDYTNFAQIRRNKRKEVQKSLTLLSTKGEKEFSLLANNIYLGICYEKLFKELENE